MAQSLTDMLAGVAVEARVKTVLFVGRERYRRATGPEWLGEFDAECREAQGQLTTEQWRVAASDLAWWVRQRRTDDSDLVRTPQFDPTQSPTTPPAMALLVSAQYLRYDFRFGELDRLLRFVGHADALLHALHVFSKLGAGREVSEQEITRIRNAPDSDAKVLHCLLHGLCVCPNPAPRAALIVDISNELEPLLDRPDPVLFYRRSIGYRLLGRLDEADAAVRRAISLEPPDNTVHQQLHNEMTAIASEAQLGDRLRRQEEDFTQRLEELRASTLAEISDTLRGGLVANFQILTIFLTLAGFVGTAGATVLRLADAKISWLRGVSTLGILLVFTFLVFLGSRYLIEGRSRRRRP